MLLEWNFARMEQEERQNKESNDKDIQICHYDNPANNQRKLMTINFFFFYSIHLCGVNCLSWKVIFLKFFRKFNALN